MMTGAQAVVGMWASASMALVALVAIEDEGE